MKQTKVSLICLLMFFVSVAVSAQTVLGDVDYNGTINIIDALKVAQFTVTQDPGSLDWTNCDVNVDSSVNIVDALIIAQYSAGLVKIPPASKGPVVLDQLSPVSGGSSTQVAMTGSGFTPTLNKIIFTKSGGTGYYQTYVSSTDGNNIKFTIPNMIGSVCDYWPRPCPGPVMYIQNGDYKIEVINSNGVSNILIFTVTGVS